MQSHCDRSSEEQVPKKETCSNPPDVPTRLDRTISVSPVNDLMWQNMNNELDHEGVVWKKQCTSMNLCLLPAVIKLSRDVGIAGVKQSKN